MPAILDSTTVAQYLSDNPHFFEDYAALLSEVRLTSNVTGRAISLQERQMEVMRTKYKALELKLGNLIDTAQDNAALLQKFQGWTQTLLQEQDSADLPRTLLTALQTQFDVAHATLRLWPVAASHAQAWFAQDVSEDVQLFAHGLLTPYCGSNRDFEAARWLEQDAAPIASTALIALRTPQGAGFGLLVLGAPDAGRFTAHMATDFLTSLGATASAALHSWHA